MSANETKYQYSSNILGTFEFAGTKSEWETLLTDLRNASPEFDGKLGTGSTLDTLAGQKRGEYHECLTYDGECIAIAIEE